MRLHGLEALTSAVSESDPVRNIGRITEIGGGLVRIRSSQGDWSLGDQVRFNGGGQTRGGEVIRVEETGATVLPDGPLEGLRSGDGVEHAGRLSLCPDASWLGRVIDPYGQPLDGRPLRRGGRDYPLVAPAPAPVTRRRLGPRLSTGMAAFDTVLPVVRGQRLGLFAGSGVGKSMLLADLARGIEADVVVIALVGERGRELRDFVEDTLGPEGMARGVVVAATSDRSPLVRRRCALAAMAVAEYFRDTGRCVLFLADSVTRLAEAHREIALASGEPPALRGFPPSTSHLIMALAERAGPGPEGSGDITALFTVLVAGSDMDEPVADILRGVLDGHVVLDRDIAERGRYPAINLLRSVSRSLPAAASVQENTMILRARRLLGAYDRVEMMVQAGLYIPGSDPLADEAIRVWPALDAFLAERSPDGNSAAFERLQDIIGGHGTSPLAIAPNG